LSGIIILLLGFALSVRAAENTFDLSSLENSLKAQKKIRSISADFIQTRALKTLKSPLAIKGRFWFEAPDRFRWELGEPAKSIIIGSRQELTIIQPLKKKVEKIDLTKASHTKNGPEFIRMMEMISSNSLENFQKEMHIISLKNLGPNCRLEVVPKNPETAKGLSSLLLDFEQSTGYWVAFELVTKEGSSMRTEFQNVRLNAKLASNTFEYDMTGFTIDEASR
jgi:outer membrane lipoprotein-sorting protein